MSKTVNITLSGPMKKWAQEQAAKRGFRSANAFFQEIIRRERRADVKERLEDSLEEAVAEGEAVPMTQKDWDDIRAKGRELAKVRRRK